MLSSCGCHSEFILKSVPTLFVLVTASGNVHGLYSGRDLNLVPHTLKRVFSGNILCGDRILDGGMSLKKFMLAKAVQDESSRPSVRAAQKRGRRLTKPLKKTRVEKWPKFGAYGNSRLATITSVRCRQVVVGCRRDNVWHLCMAEKGRERQKQKHTTVGIR